jgi:hypothetical protein
VHRTLLCPGCCGIQSVLTTIKFSDPDLFGRESGKSERNLGLGREGSAQLSPAFRHLNLKIKIINKFKKLGRQNQDAQFICHSPVVYLYLSVFSALPP